MNFLTLACSEGWLSLTDRTIAAWSECVPTGGNWDIEHRFRGMDGQWHDILARGVPVREETGDVVCWAGINLAISRLKQVEESLRASEERFRIVASSTPDHVLVQDRELRYVLVVNPCNWA